MNSSAYMKPPLATTASSALMFGMHSLGMCYLLHPPSPMGLPFQLPGILLPFTMILYDQRSQVQLTTLLVMQLPNLTNM